MRRIQRPPLSDSAHAVLDEFTRGVLKAPDPAKFSGSQWKSRKASERRPEVRAAFEEIEHKLEQMAPGRGRCVYCEDSRGAEVDHFCPKSRAPGLTFRWHNLLWACGGCNKRKLAQFPRSDEDRPLLIDPSSGDDPATHLALSPSTGRFEPLDRRGRESEQVYALNRKTFPEDRLSSWRAIEGLLALWGRANAQGYAARAATLRDDLLAIPFSAVFKALLGVARTSHAAALIDRDALAVLCANPEIHDWIADW